MSCYYFRHVQKDKNWNILEKKHWNTQNLHDPQRTSADLLGVKGLVHQIMSTACLISSFITFFLTMVPYRRNVENTLKS